MRRLFNSLTLPMAPPYRKVWCQRNGLGHTSNGPTTCLPSILVSVVQSSARSEGQAEPPCLCVAMDHETFFLPLLPICELYV